MRVPLATFWYASVLISLLAGHVRADDNVYGKPPPPDAAIVRVFNASEASAEQVSFGGALFEVQPLTMSEYQYLTSGEYDVAGLHIKVEPQHFYTVVSGGPAPQVLEDQVISSPARAGLYFYNVTTKPATLTATVGGKSRVVFDAVAPGGSAFREVQAFQVSFSVSSEGEAPVELPPVTLQNKQGVSVVASGAGGKLSSQQLVNSIDQKQR